MQIQLDPSIPSNLSPDELRDFKSFLDVALDGLTAAAGGEIFTTGNALWTALSLIVVVLTGAKVAFSGTIQPWEIIKMVIGLWIPWVMLQFYTTLIPGMAFTFPGMIAAGGNWLHNLLIGDAVYAMQTELGNLVHTMTANIEAQAEQGDIIGVIRGGVHSLLTLIAGVGDDLLHGSHARLACGNYLRSGHMGADRPRPSHHPGSDVHSVSGL